MLPQRACTRVLLQDEGRKASQKIFIPGVCISWCHGSLLNCSCVHLPSGLSAQHQLILKCLFCTPVSGVQHDPPVLQLMGVLHGYPLPPELRCCLIEWWCCGSGASYFFLPPSRSCCSLNPTAACHSVGSPVISFITVPGKSQFIPRFCELKRLTEKSMCRSKERSKSSRCIENKERNLSFHGSKLLNLLIIPCILQNQTCYCSKMVLYIFKKPRNPFL